MILIAQLFRLSFSSGPGLCPDAAKQKKIYSDVKWLPIEKTVKCEILAKLGASRGLCEC